VRILGIDCGCERTGYGLIESDGVHHTLVASGVVATSPKQPLAERLKTISHGVRDVLVRYAPEAVAVEEVFYAQNAKTAIRLSHARGVVLLAIAEAGLEMSEYSPLEVKTSVTGYGRAEKRQVQVMVQSLLKLDEILASEDASDAVAIAICHATRCGAPVATGRRG
jgi:crossover junction endodeoxyribonuclease RuvC